MRNRATNKIPHLLILFIIPLTSLAGAKAQDRKGVSENSQAILKPELLNPYIIEWYIDINEDVDLRQIWRQLGIETRMPYRCDQCLSETFDIESDSEESKVVALKISSGNGDYHQYLIFRKAISASAREEWKFMGNIDSGNQGSAAPAHRVEDSESRVWFILRELWGRESGRKAYGEVWYEIKEKSLKRVLSYPVAGENEPCRKDMGYSYKTIISRHGSENGTYVVPIHFLTSYNISNCEKGKVSPALFVKEQKAHYVWNQEREQFILDAAQSSITEKEINSIYGITVPTSEEIAEYNFDKLSAIASSGTVEQKDWLRRFLNNLQDSLRKTTLLRAMQQ